MTGAQMPQAKSPVASRRLAARQAPPARRRERHFPVAKFLATSV